jgi:hypothetical protein
MQRWRTKSNEVQHGMNEQKGMTWYGGDLNQKKKLT